MEQYTTFKKLINKLEEFANRHPNINSFGFGNLIEFGKDVDNTAPLYPLLFVVPQSIDYNEGLTSYGLQIFLADRLDNDNDGAVDIVSQMSLISKDLLATFKLNEDFMYLADFDFPLVAAPFMERFNDVLAGVSTNITFNVSDYLDVCQLNPLLKSKYYIDFTEAPNLGGFKPYGYLRVSINGVVELELDGSGTTGNYELELNEGDVVSQQFIYPQTPVVAVGYGNMSISANTEPIYSDICSPGDNFTFTAETGDYYNKTYYDVDCSDSYEVNIYTRNGLWTGTSAGIYGNIQTTSPIRDFDFGINSGSTFVKSNTYDNNFGAITTITLYDNLSGFGYGRTSIVVNQNGGQIYEDNCGSPLTYSFSATSPNDVFDIYLEGDETCPILPTPTPTITATPTETPQPTPTITPTSQPTPTPSITASITPTPTPVFYNILTEDSDDILTEGGDNLRREQDI